MSAPSPAPGDDRPREGYYPDPSIPGYVRYWNGSSWVPGTSRPAPSGGEPLMPPSPSGPGSPPASGPSGAPTPSVASVEETGPHFFDEDPVPADQQYGGRSEPSSAWGADRSHQSGFGGDQDRKVSWGSPQGPDPRVGEAEPVGPSGPGSGSGDVVSDGTFVFRRPAGGPPSGTAPSDVGGTGGDPGTMTFRAPSPRTSDASGAPGARPGSTTSPAAAGPSVPGLQGPVGASGNGGPAGAGGAAAAPAPASAATPVSAAPAPASAATPASAAPAPASAATPASAAPPGVDAAPAAPAARSQIPGRPAPAQPTGPAAPAAPAPPAAALQTSQPPVPAPAPPAPVPQAGPAPGVPAQPGPQPPQPQPAAVAPAAPVSAGPGGGQQSWAQQVHQLAGGGDDQPVVPWKPPVDDVFQAAARRQASARPAGLGKRLVARFVDTLVVGGVTAAAAVPLGTKAVEHVNDKIDAAKQSGETVTVWLLDGTTSVYLGIVLAVMLVFGVLYEALPTAKWGRTLGKKLLGLEVRDIEGGEPPSFGAALRRWLVYSVPGLLAVGVLGVLWCVFDRPWRQCWHDKAAHTFVAG
ncbi:RDD family protein [Streptomyces sp. BK239]|uniref:RDD family protein n=1 Tax=Streptomyces sp. BK239 TaxID=2512155 RepID=UPI00102AE37E|nr:RDD family protein [Streptomyces sp. BK239]RZU24627.1 putative RDD family membrane protein YckC [Streptomyces sp. BK239]